MAVHVAGLVSGAEVERNPESVPKYLMCVGDDRLGVGV